MVRKYGLYAAWLIATFGLMMSLYYSDIKNMEPCHLCWYQRICLFPLVLILAIATYKGFNGIAAYALPLTFIGFLLALYQIAIQEIPGWNPIDMCGAGPSCSEKILIGIGPLTVPMLAAFGFLIITLILACVWLNEKRCCASEKQALS